MRAHLRPRTISWSRPKIDKGFYDADFGLFHLKVVVGLDDRFRIAIDDDRVEINDPARVEYTVLDHAKMGAYEFGAKLLRKGADRLVEMMIPIAQQIAETSNSEWKAAQQARQGVKISMPYDGPADANPFKPTVGTEVAICDHWPRPLHVNNRVEPIPTTNVHWANLCRDCHALMGDQPENLRVRVIVWTEKDAQHQ